MNETDRSETAAPAVGTPLDCGVGRLEPERTTVDVSLSGKRLRTYRVHFNGGEAVEVSLQNIRPFTRPFWRLLWVKGDDKPMGFSAAIAIRAALAKVESAS